MALKLSSEIVMEPLRKAVNSDVELESTDI